MGLVNNLALAAGFCALMAAAFTTQGSEGVRSSSRVASTTPGSDGVQISGVRVAFAGNSVLYYNDCPRLLEAIAGGTRAVSTDCCLRGGATLKSLLDKGVGDAFELPANRREDGTCDSGAPTVQALLSVPWDFVVMNDFTQGPARAESRAASVAVLVERYAPLLERCGATPVLLQTWAYRAPTRGSDDLGDHEQFTSALIDGVRVYQRALAAAGLAATRVARVGDAFLAVRREDPDLWRALFHTDDFHLSPSGTYLEASVLHATLFGEPPPQAAADAGALFDRARVMQPPDEPALPLPTPEEMAYFRRVAAGFAEH